MRQKLIDVDKIKSKYNDNWPSEIAEGFQIAIDAIEDTPTVDAIPIKWLKDELMAKAKQLGATTYVDNIQFVLDDWEAWKKYRG